MTVIYAGPVFEMARTQFHRIADRLELPDGRRTRFLFSKRAMMISCPIHLDSGEVAVFQGPRVQRHLTLGPTKGGILAISSAAKGRDEIWPCPLVGESNKI